METMISALINGLIGLAASIGIGIGIFQFSIGDVFFFVGVSNISAVISLLFTLRAEKLPWLKRNYLNHFLKTWFLLGSLYFGILLLLCPELRSFRPLVGLALPLILSTGFGIIQFGPIQDFLTKRDQKKSSSIRPPVVTPSAEP